MLQEGQKVIVRSNMSGCWHGLLVRMTDTQVTLADARRLFRWWAAKGASLSSVAVYGLDPDRVDQCRIEPPVPAAIVADYCEILSVTDDASASIEAVEVTR